MAKEQYLGTGRRKSSVARVRLTQGTGTITINGRDIEEYFGYETLKILVRSPFEIAERVGAYDVDVNVFGGGYTGQAGAIRHGIARALIQAEPELRTAVKRAGFLTRDSRMKERRSTASRRLAALRSSASVNRSFETSKNPGNMRLPGFFLSLFWLTKFDEF